MSTSFFPCILKGRRFNPLSRVWSCSLCLSYISSLIKPKMSNVSAKHSQCSQGRETANLCRKDDLSFASGILQHYKAIAGKHFQSFDELFSTLNPCSLHSDRDCSNQSLISCTQSLFTRVPYTYTSEKMNLKEA